MTSSVPSSPEVSKGGNCNQNVSRRSNHEKRTHYIVVNAEEPAVCHKNCSGMESQNYSPRILLVEDDAAIRRLTSCALRHAGFEVVEACTADDGVTRIGDPSIDAIITDVEMPGALNGYDLAWQAHLQRPEAPVFVVSGSIESDRRDLPPQVQFFDKPVDPWLLVAQLHGALSSIDREPPRAVA